MSPHSIATSAIEAAIETMLLPGSGPVEDAKAETLVVAYFSPRHRRRGVQTLLRAHSAYCRSAQGGCMTTPIFPSIIDDRLPRSLRPCQTIESCWCSRA